MLKAEYDLIVVGAGPGGSMAALTAAKKGLQVCLLEKISKIGSRVRCGEAIGETALKQFFKPQNNWIAEQIDFCKIISPSLLVYLDLIFQKLFSWTHLTPSIYILCQK